jgi:general secretion pathway protein A
VHLHNPALTRTEFVEMLATKFELSPEARSSKTALLVELDALLRRRQAAGESTVLIVDEAQSLPLDLLEEIRLLANIETDDEKLLSVIIAGQPEIAARLNEATLRQLKQRIALRCELHPLTLMESAAYLAGRIRAAGGVGAQVFTREAVTFIHERSGGIPRTISVIADNALLSGFAMGQRPVGTAIVREVCRDFDLPALAERDEQTEKPPTPAEATSHSHGDATRLISFDTPSEQASTASRKTPDAVGTGKSDDSESDNSGSMFSSSVPKRRRFSFF